jgi:hypothetical protein
VFHRGKTDREEIKMITITDKASENIQKKGGIIHLIDYSNISMC